MLDGIVIVTKKQQPPNHKSRSQALGHPYWNSLPVLTETRFVERKERFNSFSSC